MASSHEPYLIVFFFQAKEAVWAPGLVIGICACIVCLLTLFLPETSKRELPQTIPELQAWFKQKNRARNSEREEVIGGGLGLVPKSSVI